VDGELQTAVFARETALACLFVITASLQARAENCFGLPTVQQRAACYQNNPSQTAEPDSGLPKTSASTASLDDRRRFRADIEKAFLSHGITMDLFASGPNETTLTFWGFISKAVVYQLITDGRILENAKARGFRKIDFDDRGEDGQWIFDLTGAVLPACDNARRVCR
jgi:hypothetical protein